MSGIEFVAMFATIPNHLLTESVAIGSPIVFPDTAIVAVIPAIITYFDQSAYVDSLSEVCGRYFPCLLIDVCQGFIIIVRQQVCELFGGEGALLP